MPLVPDNMLAQVADTATAIITQIDKYLTGQIRRQKLDRDITLSLTNFVDRMLDMAREEARAMYQQQQTNPN